MTKVELRRRIESLPTSLNPQSLIPSHAVHRRHSRTNPFDRPADFVALTLFDGEIGIAPGHTPLIGRLGYGEMRIRREERTDRYYVEGGFVEVLGDVVTVLTPRAVPASEIDPAVVQEQLTRRIARRRLARIGGTSRSYGRQSGRGGCHLARRVGK